MALAGIPLDNVIGTPGGSTGKTFVAALAMLLVEDGTLSLDDPGRRDSSSPWPAGSCATAVPTSNPRS
ncbi:MAG: serine hydrolase [Thermoanaerobaculia bacterium]